MEIFGVAVTPGDPLPDGVPEHKLRAFHAAGWIRPVVTETGETTIRNQKGENE